MRKRDWKVIGDGFVDTEEGIEMIKEGIEMINSDIKDICKRIRREHPHIKIISEAHLWTSDTCVSECGEDECSPEFELTWETLFNKLESIGIYVTKVRKIGEKI